jgi:hypothetical protein
VGDCSPTPVSSPKHVKWKRNRWGEGHLWEMRWSQGGGKGRRFGNPLFFSENMHCRFLFDECWTVVSGNYFLRGCLMYHTRTDNVTSPYTSIEMTIRWSRWFGLKRLRSLLLTCSPDLLRRMTVRPFNAKIYCSVCCNWHQSAATKWYKKNSFVAFSSQSEVVGGVPKSILAYIITF